MITIESLVDCLKTRKEKLIHIIKQNGDCSGVSCRNFEECPFIDQENMGSCIFAPYMAVGTSPEDAIPMRYQMAVEKFVETYGKEDLVEALL